MRVRICGCARACAYCILYMRVCLCALVGQVGSLIVNTVWASAGIEMLSRNSFRINNPSVPQEDEASHSQMAAASAITRLRAKADRIKRENLWHPVSHDRRVELVFIGKKDEMDETRLRSALEEALLTKDELEEFLHEYEIGQAPFSVENNPFAEVPRCIVI